MVAEKKNFSVDPFSDFDPRAEVTSGVEDSSSILESVLETCRQRAFDDGYARGTNDVLALLVLLTERFVRADPASRQPVRKALLDFNDYVHDYLKRPPDSASYVEGGLGI